MKTLLLLFTSFTALTAILSGAMLMAVPNGSSLHLSPIILNNTPFNNFSIPGIILLFVIGLSNLFAIFTIMRRHQRAYSFSQAAGLLLIGWIIIQMLLISGSWWLQWIYLFIGIAILLISTQLKGKALF